MFIPVSILAQEATRNKGLFPGAQVRLYATPSLVHSQGTRSAIGDHQAHGLYILFLKNELCGHAGRSWILKRELPLPKTCRTSEKALHE